MSGAPGRWSVGDVVAGAARQQRVGSDQARCGVGVLRRYHVLDACCGSRMFWFDHNRYDVVFADNRIETHVLKDQSSSGGCRTLTVRPSVQADFRSLPFIDAVFELVVFDPPHFLRNGQSGWMAKKYGVLDRVTWRDDLRAGFAECFRVCRAFGTVIFKWNENEIALSEVLNLAQVEPLFGNRFGKHQQSHFIIFQKVET